MLEFDALKATVTTIEADLGGAVTAIQAKDAEIVTLKAEIATLQADAVAPVDVAAVDTSLKAAAAPLESLLNPAPAPAG